MVQGDTVRGSACLTNKPQTDSAALNVRLCHWPNGVSFALFLSHDIDQIHDREFWKVLADLNHVKRHLFDGERGNVSLAINRIGRSLFRPKPAIRGFETILDIEGHHGFRSTFFLLHDRYWARNGARYRLSDPQLADIVERVLGTGSEVAVHGGYYAFNDAAAYRASRELISETFGVHPTGIRNHLLRFSGGATWQAQAEAGFSYDATFGYRDRFGAPKDRCEPFWAEDDAGRPLDLVELPLTVMDTTVFRYLGLAGESAVSAVIETVDAVVSRGGLVTLLWHNNYFNEPEYEDWQQTYVAVLDHLAKQEPWCATGAEIAGWWRARSTVTVSVDEIPGDCLQVLVRTGESIDGVTLEFAPEFASCSFVVDGEIMPVRSEAGRPKLALPRLDADTEKVVELVR